MANAVLQTRSASGNSHILFDEWKWLVALVVTALSATPALADTYTWTGSASAVWDKTTANWDKGVWVDGNVAKFPASVSRKNITLGADVSVTDIEIASGNWSLGGAHTLTISKTGGAKIGRAHV